MKKMKYEIGPGPCPVFILKGHISTALSVCFSVIIWKTKPVKSYYYW